jgi:hypothetical protein
VLTILNFCKLGVEIVPIDTFENQIRIQWFLFEGIWEDSICHNYFFSSRKNTLKPSKIFGL